MRKSLGRPDFFVVCFSSCGAVILHNHLQALPPLVHIDIRIVYDVNPDPLRTSSLIEFFQGRTAEMFLQKQMEPLQIAEIHQVIAPAAFVRRTVFAHIAVFTKNTAAYEADVLLRKDRLAVAVAKGSRTDSCFTNAVVT